MTDMNDRYVSVQKFGNKRSPLASTGQFVKFTEDSAEWNPSAKSSWSKTKRGSTCQNSAASGKTDAG